MKKQNVFIVLLVIVMLFTLVSCRSSDDSNSASLGNDSTTEQSMAPVVENTTDKTQLVVGADYEPTNLQYYVNATDSQKSSTLRFMIHCLHLIMERSFPHLQQAMNLLGKMIWIWLLLCGTM